MGAYTVLLIGKTGHGKSSLGNSILGRYGKQNRVFESSPKGGSMTKHVQSAKGEVDGVSFIVVDTPGVMDTDDPIKHILEEIARCHKYCPNGIDALLMTVPYGQRFTTEETLALKQLEGMFGEDLFEYGIVIFTKGDQFEQHLEDGDIESFDDYLSGQPKDLKEVMKKVGSRYVLFDNTARGEKAKDQRGKLVSEIKKIEIITGKPYQNKFTDMAKVGRDVDVISRELVKEKASTITTSGDGGCFPAVSTVMLDGGKTNAMEDLLIGADVLSIAERDNKPFLDTVYFTSHAKNDVLAPFVCIQTASGKQLHLSESHYIYVGQDALKTGTLVPARDVKVGDVVHVVDGPDQSPRPDDVTEVKVKIKRGLYCPVTLGGSLVVDGVCVSTYTDILSPRLTHGLLWPIRALHGVAPKMTSKLAQPQKQTGQPAWLGWLRDRYLAWV